MTIATLARAARRRIQMPLDSFSGRVSITFVTMMVTSGLGAVTGVLAAKLLGPQGRGELAAIQSWVLLLASLSTLGMAEAVVYWGSRLPQKIGSYLASSYVLVGLSALGFVGLGWLAMPLLLKAQSPSVVAAGRFFLLMMVPIFGSFATYETLRPLGAWHAWNLLRILPNILWLVLLLVAFVVRPLADSIILSRLFPAIFLAQIIPALLIVKRRVSRPYGIDLQLFRPLLKFGVPTVFTVLPRSLNLRLDQMVMAAFLPSYSLGLYAAAAAWSLALSPIFAAVSQVLFPYISAMHDAGQQGILLGRVFRLTVLVDILLTLMFLAVTPVVFPLLMGTAFRPAIPVAQVLVAASAFNSLNLILTGGLNGLGKPRNVMVSEVSGLAVTIALLMLLIPRLGIMGAAIASLVSYLVVFLGLSVSSKRATASPNPVADYEQR